MLHRLASGSLLLGALLAGCTSSAPPTTSSGGTGGGAGTGGRAGTGGVTGSGGALGYPAAHPPMPQAVSDKGPVMTAPNLVAISFEGDTLQGSLDTFITQIAAAKAYWSGATGQYGVGPLTAAPPQHLAETAATSLTDLEVQQWLTGEINGGGGFPQPDLNTLYVIFYPATTTVTLDGGTLCDAFEGYHSDYAIAPGQYVSYAVVGRCPPPVAGLSEMDEVSAEASHEIIEGATDPLPQDKPAWFNVDADHQGWALVGGGAEIGDLCAAFPDSFYTPAGITTLVQRVWSNTAAAASHDPCEPNGASPYFNSAPVLTDTITLPGSSIVTQGVQIPVGTSKTIDLDLYSDAPTSGPWQVSALDLTSAFFGGAQALSFTFDETSGQNGDTIHLTIKALATSNLGVSPFWVQNDLGSVTTVWIGLVGN
jgi:hypothetical protein